MQILILSVLILSFELSVQAQIESNETSSKLNNKSGKNCADASEINKFFIKLLTDGTNGSDYNRYEKPSKKGLTVAVKLWIQDIVTVSDTTDTVEMDIYVNERWTDPRLSYNDLNPCRANATMNQFLHDKIWTPITGFVNTKQTSVQTSPITNKFLLVYPNGTVWSNYRARISGPCTSDLKKYPMDSKQCKLIFESYMYNAEDLKLEWENTPIWPLKETGGGFQLESYKAEKLTPSYPAGNWDELVASFIFKRQNQWGSLVLQTYLPTYLIVLISWMSFFLGVKVLFGRFILGVGSFLAILLVALSVGQNLPKTDNVRGIDCWMFGCIIFIFLSLAELALVTYKSRNLESDQNSIPLVNGATTESEKSRFLITAEKIDKISIVVFPICFLLFNIIYWPAFLA